MPVVQRQDVSKPEEEKGVLDSIRDKGNEAYNDLTGSGTSTTSAGTVTGTGAGGDQDSTWLNETFHNPDGTYSKGAIGGTVAGALVLIVTIGLFARRYSKAGETVHCADCNQSYGSELIPTALEMHEIEKVSFLKMVGSFGGKRYACRHTKPSAGTTT